MLGKVSGNDKGATRRKTTDTLNRYIPAEIHLSFNLYLGACHRSPNLISKILCETPRSVNQKKKCQEVVEEEDVVGVVDFEAVEVLSELEQCRRWV